MAAVTDVCGGGYMADDCVFFGGGARGGGGRRYRLPHRTCCKEVSAAVATAAVTGVRGGRWVAEQAKRLTLHKWSSEVETIAVAT